MDIFYVVFLFFVFNIYIIDLRYYFTEYELIHLLVLNRNKVLFFATALDFASGEQRKLFTPGPLMITDRVKSAMLLDIARRHVDFTYVNE